MKMYTNESQTAKLIELGLKKPKSMIDVLGVYETDIDMEYEYEYAYSIGELIEMLDSIPNNMWNFIKTSDRIVKVEMYIFPKTKSETYYYDVCYHKELVDALFVIIVKLKEEGVI